MHPVLSTRYRVVSYFLLWMGLAVLFGLALSTVMDFDPLMGLLCAGPPLVVLGFLNLSPYYLCRANPIKGKPTLQIAVSFLIGGLLTCSAWVFVSEAWYWMLSDSFGLPYPLPISVLYAAFGASLLLYDMVTVFYYLVMTFEKSQEYERGALESRIHAQDAELRSLRAQIDPHFLFNSLNSISALTSKDPALAREMIIKLSDFFRSSLGLGREQKIPLRRELELIDNYIDLEKVRLGEKLTVERQIGEQSLDCLVPPLILQPIVENAVKHGVGNQVKGGMIRLRIMDNGTLLAVTVENTVDEEADVKSGLGLGLKNVKDRLHLIYGEEAVFRAGLSNGQYFVHFQLPSERVG
ncbi:MAG: histidine kinase [Bacteroidetes bacterium]|nr:histidine kinase [Bacteroidota bacterium]